MHNTAPDILARGCSGAPALRGGGGSANETTKRFCFSESHGVLVIMWHARDVPGMFSIINVFRAANE